MSNTLIIEPAEYATKYFYEGLDANINAAIASNELPVGMHIDYALEVLQILGSQENAKE